MFKTGVLGSHSSVTSSFAGSTLAYNIRRDALCPHRLIPAVRLPFAPNLECAPSDRVDSQELLCHNYLRRYRIANLELIALLSKIAGVYGSSVRAILQELAAY
jgi:hypothetical protein